jgi:hypothetical protein
MLGDGRAALAVVLATALALPAQGGRGVAAEPYLQLELGLMPRGGGTDAASGS